MAERAVCREVLLRSFVTRNADGQMETDVRPTPCDSDKWSYEVPITLIGPSRAGAGDTVAHTVKRRTDRPFCENGHPRGGW